MDFNVFSVETLDRSTSQHVRDTTIAATASFSMLFAQQIVMKHTTNDFSTLGVLLFAAFVLHAAVAAITNAREPPAKRKRLSLDGLDDPTTLRKLLTNGARIFVQCWLRADALHHFGFLFAFLLENVDVLLLQPLKDAFATGSKATNNNSTWLLVLLGYVLVAGVDAYAYGSLVHTFALIGIALGAHELHQRTPHATLRVAAAPQFQVLSVLTASVFTIPFAVAIGSWRARDEALFNNATDANGNYTNAPMGTPAWMGCVVATAACQTIAQHWTMDSASAIATRSRWLALMACAATGLIGSLAVSATQDDWLRCAADACATLVILVAQLRQLQRAGGGSNNTDDKHADLDMFRASASTNESVGAAALRILQVLWASNDSRKILLFLSVNVSYMFVELAVGVWTNSLGLIGDAGHMLFDNGALVIGLVASYIGKLPADRQYTYGYGRVEVLSGFLNSIALVVISFHLMLEASSRFIDPPTVSTDNLLLTSTVGLGVNIVGLVWFHDHVHSHGDSGGGCSSSSHGHSHGGASDGSASSNSNMYGVYLHVLADTLGSVGVILSSLLIEYKGWHVADPLSSAMISLLIFGSTLPLLKDTLLQLLQRVPKELERDVQKTLDDVHATVKGVVAIDQWHVWRHVNATCVGSLHVVVDDAASEQIVLQHIRAICNQRLGMDRFLTVQITKQSAIAQFNGHSHSHNHDSSQGMSTFENPAGDDASRRASSHQFLQHTQPVLRSTAGAGHPSHHHQWTGGPSTPFAPSGAAAASSFAHVHKPVEVHGHHQHHQDEAGGHGHGHGHSHSHGHGHSHGHSHGH